MANYNRTFALGPSAAPQIVPGAALVATNLTVHNPGAYPFFVFVHTSDSTPPDVTLASGVFRLLVQPGGGVSQEIAKLVPSLAAGDKYLWILTGTAAQVSINHD